LQLFQPNEIPSYDGRQTRACPWRFTSAQCGYRRGQVFVPLTTATAFSANTIGGSGLALTPNLFSGELVMVLSGTGAGQERYILSHTATTFTLKANWTTNPDGTSKFVVTGPGVPKVPATTATLFSSNTIGASGLTRVTSQDLDGAIYIIAGTGAGQNRAIIGNTATTFTVSPPWTTVPDATSVFLVTYRTCAKDLPSCTLHGVPERFSGVIFLQPQITTVNGPTAVGTGGPSSSGPLPPATPSITRGPIDPNLWSRIAGGGSY